MKLPYRPSETHRRGFTLVELLVTMAIIAVLATMSVVAYSAARTKAREAAAKSDVDQLMKAVMLLAEDTGKYPNGCPAERTSNPEVALNGAQAGIVSAPAVGNQGDGCFWTATDVAAWRGPYAANVTDPWDNPYWFDPDYTPREGCPGQTAGPLTSVVHSFGANGEGVNDYDCDDIYRVLR